MAKYTTCSYCDDLLEDSETGIHPGCVIRKRQLETKEKPEPVSIFDTLRIAKTKKERCTINECRYRIDTKISQKRCPYHAAKARRSSKAAARAYVDYDYVRTLSEEDSKWLHEFTKNYYYGQRATVTKLTTKQRRDNYNADNTRRRSVDLPMSSPLTNVNEPNMKSPEDALIDLIDRKYKKPQ